MLANLTLRQSDPVTHQRDVGATGSKRYSRTYLLDALSQGGSTPTEVGQKLMPLVHGLMHMLTTESTMRMLADASWCDTYHAAGRMAGASRNRICVLGIGTGAAAVGAAQAGAEVIWAERVVRLAQVAVEIAKANGVDDRIRVVRCARWEDLAAEAAIPGVARPLRRSFDAVISEEVGDDDVASELLRQARLARALLLRPGGRFHPRRVAVRCMLLSVRCSDVAGFDLRAFNAFRTCEFVDLEHIELTEPGVARRLSAAHTAVAIDDLSDASSTSLPLSATLRVPATAAGLLNCLCVWHELGGFPDADASLDFGPRQPPLPLERRARRQRLLMLPYERRLEAGEDVTVRLRWSEGAGLELHPDEAEAAARRAAGALEAWPRVPALAYHFHMIADEARNCCFDRALRAALRRLTKGGGDVRVLDIGAGSGLLAMMAARAGASQVSTCEMVPALAAAARHIVAANGFGGGRVAVHEARSSELSAAQLGGLADVLVCEIVDDGLLGEGVLATVADARRRLLRPGALVIPSAGSLHMVAVEMRAPRRRDNVGRRGGDGHDGPIDLSAWDVCRSDQLLSPQPVCAAKLQQLRRGAYRRLSEPIELFEWQWATMPIETIEAPRSRELPLRLTAAGTLNAFVVYFRLHCDDEHVYDSGPDNPHRAPCWDQSVRYLPVEMNVRAGDELRVRATHDVRMLTTLHIVSPPARMLTSVGHPELVGMREAEGLLVSIGAPRNVG